jgi:hypothetical protein
MVRIDLGSRVSSGVAGEAKRHANTADLLRPGFGKDFDKN